VIHPRATTEFIYRYNSPMSLRCTCRSSSQQIQESRRFPSSWKHLEKQGMKGYDISDDEMAKSHSRYMIGGAQRVENERLFRFGMCCRFQLSIFVQRKQHFQAKSLTVNTEFPERPGALRKFLLGMQTKWNISLFHYRNHGAGESNLLLHPETPLFH
jgi:threonine dehydratase